MAGQSIRPSQYITTYGPGSILEGPTGPRVISSLKRSQIYDGKNTSDFEITDQRLSRLLNNYGILRIPSNAEIGVAETVVIYSTDAFPVWSLCIKHKILYQPNRQTLTGCPFCMRPESAFKLYEKAHGEAIRFVKACPDGHMDDLDWIGMVHKGKPICNTQYLLWKGGGGSLKNVNVECPKCDCKLNLGLAYATEWSCSGRFPEDGYNRPGCERKAKIFQRGAANLRIPEIVTAITIPELDTRLHSLLGKQLIFSILLVNNPTSKNQLVTSLKRLVDNGLLGLPIYDEINDTPEPLLLETIQDVLKGTGPITAKDFINNEFLELCRGATRGAPAKKPSTPGAPPYFEIIKPDVRVFNMPNGNKIRVTPVSRLRVVMAQTGYRRIETQGNAVVSCAYNDGLKDWYPGVELFGEGVFIDLFPGKGNMLPAKHFILNGPEKDDWFSAFKAPGNYTRLFTPGLPEQLHPVFVWWHTLSHRIINTLSIDSGYSSAAIRERVYTIVDPSSMDASGGILLYTTQPGGDGTLGGLISLVSNFDKIIESALRNLDACSNDPLCGEERFGLNKCNGSACYACLLISETSCEHRNMKLDRNLLLRNLP